MHKFKIGDRVQLARSRGQIGVVEGVGLSIREQQIINGHGFLVVKTGVGVEVAWGQNIRRNVHHEEDLVLVVEI